MKIQQKLINDREHNSFYLPRAQIDNNVHDCNSKKREKKIY